MIDSLEMIEVIACRLDDEDSTNMRLQAIDRKRIGRIAQDLRSDQVLIYLIDGTVLRAQTSYHDILRQIVTLKVNRSLKPPSEPTKPHHWTQNTPSERGYYWLYGTMPDQEVAALYLIVLESEGDQLVYKAVMPDRIMRIESLKFGTPYWWMKIEIPDLLNRSEFYAGPFARPLPPNANARVGEHVHIWKMWMRTGGGGYIDATDVEMCTICGATRPMQSSRQFQIYAGYQGVGYVLVADNDTQNGAFDEVRRSLQFSDPNATFRVVDAFTSAIIKEGRQEFLVNAP